MNKELSFLLRELFDNLITTYLASKLSGSKGLAAYAAFLALRNLACSVGYTFDETDLGFTLSKHGRVVFNRTNNFVSL